MKVWFVFLISFLALSCESNNIDSHLLIGSWKITNVIRDPNTSEKISFFGNDSVLIEFFSGDSLTHKYAGKYMVSDKNQTLITQYEDSTFSFKILKLTGKEMMLQTKNSEIPTRLLRY